MKCLIIIGNGFDLAHNLHTGYCDFKEYLLSHNSRSGERQFYDALCKYISEDELWSDFEASLGYLDDIQIQEENSCYLLSYSDENWRDSAHHDFQYQIQEELSFAGEIPRYLTEWINSIDTNVMSILSSSIINSDNIYISFNYTDTLETVYDISSDDILYIHGKALNGDNLVVGHHDTSLLQKNSVSSYNAAEEHGVYFEDPDEDVRIAEGKEIIREYYRNTYKNTQEIINSNHDFFASLDQISDVYVLGHSLSSIDMDYFVEIRKNVSDSCKWYISYHTRIDNNARKFIEKLNISNYEFVKIEEI